MFKSLCLNEIFEKFLMGSLIMLWLLLWALFLSLVSFIHLTKSGSGLALMKQITLT